MKNRWITGIIFIILGALIALGPKYLFPVCEPMENNIMKCFWTGRAELGIGILIAIIGLFILLSKDSRVRLGFSVSIAFTGILAFLIPNVLIGVCPGEMMSCHALALPALSILSIIVAAAGVLNSLYLLKKSKSIEAQNEKKSTDK